MQCLLCAHHRAFSSALPAVAAAAAAAAAFSPSRLQGMDAAQVAAPAGSALALGSAAQALLQARGVTGAALLCMDLPRLEALGLPLAEAAALAGAVERARHGGPRTVRLMLGAGRQPVAATFDTPQELEAFLTRQGAAGLRSSEQVLALRLSALREGEVYWLDVCDGGNLQAEVARIKASSATDAKAVIESVKRAVVAASAAVFGEALAADPRSDILLKWEGKVLGDVDCLFRGPTLHLLLECRRRVKASDVSLLLKQLAVTKEAYVRLGHSLVRGREAACRVECMVFAEAMDSAAQEALLGAGVYVLRKEGMRVIAPEARTRLEGGC